MPGIEYVGKVNVSIKDPEQPAMTPQIAEVQISVVITKRLPLALNEIDIFYQHRLLLQAAYKIPFLFFRHSSCANTGIRLNIWYNIHF